MARVEAPALRDYLAGEGAPRFFWEPDAAARYRDLRHGSCLGGRLAELIGRSVVIATAGQLTAALALIELDGRARRLLILPPDVPPAQVDALVAAAAVDAAVVDAATPPEIARTVAVRVTAAPTIAAAPAAATPRWRSEWLL